MPDKRHRTTFELTATDQATRVFKTVGSGLQDLKAQYVGFGAAAAGLFAAGGIASFIADATLYRAALDDIADTTGDNVRTLDALARQYKISTGEIDGFSASLSKLAKNLNNADDDGKAAAEAIKAIGLNLADLQAKKPGEQMLDIARALSQWADGQGKVSAAVALFGKDGARLLPFLKDLAEAGELQGRITAENAAQAERLEKEWRRLQQAFADSKQELATGTIPYLAQMTEQMSESIRVAGGLAGAIRMLWNIGPTSSTMVADRITETQLALEKWQQAGPIGKFFQKPLGATYAGTEGDFKKQLEFLKFVQRQAALELTGPEFLDARDLMAKPALNFKPTEKRNRGERGLSSFDARLLELRQQAVRDETGPSEFMDTSLAIRAGKYKVVDEATGKARDLTEAEKRLVLQEAAARDMARDLKRIREEGNKAYEDAVKASDDYRNALALELEQLRTLADPSRIYLADQKKIAEMKRVLGISDEEAVKLQRALFESKNGIKALGDETSIAADAGHQLGLSFNSALERVVFDTDRAIHGMDLLKAATVDVAKVIYGRTVAEPLAGATQAAIGNLFKSFMSSDVYVSGTMTSEAAGMLGQAFAGGGVMTPYGPMPLRRYAGGGVADSPQVAVYGEGSMNEAYVPLPDGRSIPVNMRGGGDSYHVAIDARGADRAGLLRLEATLRSMNATVEHRAIKAIRRDIYRRGGR